VFPNSPNPADANDWSRAGHGALHAALGARRGRLLFGAVLVLLLLAPIPFGSVRSWAWALELAVVCGLLACLALSPKGLHALRPYRGPLLLLAGVLSAAVGVSLLPPMSEASAAAWRLLDGTAVGAVRPVQSVTPFASLDHVARIGLYAATFAVAVCLLTGERRCRRLVTVVFATGLAVAVYGLYEHARGNQEILWYAREYRNTAGPFVSRNHFAHFVGLAMLCGVFLIDQHLRRLLRRASGSVYAALADPAVLAIGTAAAGVVVLCVALFLSSSRAATVIALGALAFYIVARRPWRRSGRWGMALLAAGIAIPPIYAAVVSVGARGVVWGRFADLLQHGGVRGELYATTLGLIRDNWLLGTGLGSFRDVFQQARGPDLADFSLAAAHAHNEYLEMALELGVPLALLYFGAIAWLLTGLVRGVRQGERYACLGAAVTALVALHALVEFPTQLPAISITLAALVAACLQGSAIRLHRRRHRHAAGDDARPQQAEAAARERYDAGVEGPTQPSADRR